MDITTITQQAKDRLLKEKEHPPVLYVAFAGKTKTTTEIVEMNWLACERDEQARHFFGVARHLARQRRWDAKKVSEIYLLVGAWIRLYKTDEAGRVLEENQSFKEALAVSHLTVHPYVTTVQQIEILRDGEGNLVDLLPTEQIIACEVLLLDAFWEGIASSDLSDKKLNRLMKKAMKGKH